jgi:hypothetical protein
VRSSHLVAALLIAAAPGISAQSEPVASRPTAPPVQVIDTTEQILTQQGQPYRPSCWRAHAQCKTYFLTDLGVEFPVWSTKHADPLTSAGRAADFKIRPVWTVGLMGVIGRHAHGGAFSLVGENGGDGIPLIFEYRYRNWLNQSAAFDAAIGYKQNGFMLPSLGEVPAKGLTAMVALTPNRWIGVSARADFMRAAGARHALLLGVQSTRVSEEAFKLVFVTAVRALLEKIGIDTSNEN